MPLKIKGFFSKYRAGRTYTFRIRKPPVAQAVDDLVQPALNELHTFVVADYTFVVADKPTPNDGLFIVTTNDDAVSADRILRMLNDRFDLNAEFLEESGEH